MAYIWHMTAQFEDGAQASRFRDFFNAGAFRVPWAGEVRLDVAVEMAEEWECRVLPKAGGGHLNGHGGPSDEREAEDLLEAGRVLYRRLRQAPPFRSALCGVEVGNWLTKDEFVVRAAEGDFDDRPDAYHGLVLSEAFWRELGSLRAFVPFGDGTVWIPWAGPAEGASPGRVSVAP